MLSLRTKLVSTQKALIWLCKVCHLVLFFTTGCRVIRPRKDVQTSKPVIVISNHQSAFDISSIVLTFPNLRFYFIAKRELGKGIPSVSLLLREYNGILIDRSNSFEAVKRIEDFLNLEKTPNLVIFPEGTRSRSGALGPLKRRGLVTILDHLGEAKIVSFIFSKNYRFGNPLFFPFFVKSEMIFVQEYDFSRGSLNSESFVSQIFEDLNTVYLNTFNLKIN